MSQGFTKAITLDTDGTLAANSDALVPSQKAIKTYVDARANATHTGDVTGATALTLVNTAVTPGSYTSTNLTVDSKGRITAASNGSGGGTPAGSTTQVQYNNAGAFGGASNILVKDNSLVLNNEAAATTASTDTSKLTSFKVGNGVSMPGFLSEGGFKLIQPFIGQGRISYLQPLGMSGTVITTVGMQITTTGTPTGAAFTSGSIKDSIRRIEYVGSTSATSVGGYQATPVGLLWFGNVTGAGGFLYVHRWGLAAGPTLSTNIRSFAGMRNVNAAPTDVNPSTLVNMFGMGCDAADTQMQFMHNDLTGTATKIPLGASFTKPATDRSAYYELIMYSAPNSQTVQYSVKNLDTLAYVTGSVNTNLPNNITQFQPYGYVSAGGTTCVAGYSFGCMYIQENN